MTVHLVEAGLAWPPDTFVQQKLDGLVERGVRVTVLAIPASAPGPSHPGIEVIHLPRGVRGNVLGCARAAMRLLRRRPMLLLRAIATPIPPRPRIRRGRRLWLLAQLAELRPDVVHCEWETAAIRYLQLVELTGCALVMSCHGGLGLYSRSPTHGAALRRISDAFDRAAAVHCVADATMAEATRHGLDPARAHIIRAAVDLDLFRPLTSADRKSE